MLLAGTAEHAQLERTQVVVTVDGHVAIDLQLAGEIMPERTLLHRLNRCPHCAGCSRPGASAASGPPSPGSRSRCSTAWTRTWRTCRRSIRSPTASSSHSCTEVAACCAPSTPTRSSCACSPTPGATGWLGPPSLCGCSPRGDATDCPTRTCSPAAPSCSPSPARGSQTRPPCPPTPSHRTPASATPRARTTACSAKHSASVPDGCRSSPVAPPGSSASGVVNNTPISHAVDAGADTVWVLSTGYACAPREPPPSALAMALHALTLTVNQRLAVDVARYEAPSTYGSFLRSARSERHRRTSAQAPSSSAGRTRPRASGFAHHTLGSTRPPCYGHTCIRTLRRERTDARSFIGIDRPVGWLAPRYRSHGRSSWNRSSQ